MKTSINRRGAFRTGAALAAAGAGLALGVHGSPAGARAAGATALHLEADTVVVTGVIFSRDGGVAKAGVPRQQGDHCNAAWRLHELDQTDREPIGEWHCMGPWVGSTREKGEPGGAFLVTAQIELYGRGKLSGLVYCGPDWYDGTITGGTAAFHSASGSFRWGPLGGGVYRMQFDLLLPEHH